MSIYKKLFLLWDKHTIGCCRVMFLLLFPSAIFRTFAQVYCCFLLLMWLILKTGYEEKWKDGENDG